MTAYNQQMKKTIHIKGMHCRSCEILLEEEFSKIDGVLKVTADFKKSVVHLVTNDSEINKSDIEKASKNAGYEVNWDAKSDQITLESSNSSCEVNSSGRKLIFSENPNDYVDLFVAFVLLAALYVSSKVFGISLPELSENGDFSSLPTALLIGLTAGFSTCMALVGGLSLSLAAKITAEGKKTHFLTRLQPHLYFNLGRIVIFAALGAVMGQLGSILQISSTVVGLLMLLAASFMLIIGIQITDVAPILNTINFSLPKFFYRVLGVKQKSQANYSNQGAFILGGLTFFVPCGFTQAAQIYSISTGSAVAGALTMGTFAIGTTPGLLTIASTASLTNAKNSFTRFLLKFIGIVVIALAVVNIFNALNLLGINTDISTDDSSSISSTVSGNAQVVEMTQNTSGYSPSVINIKKDVPVRWVITSTDQYTCASSIIMPEMGIQKNLSLGKNVIEFTPTKAGILNFTCSMGMYRGRFIVS